MLDDACGVWGRQCKHTLALVLVLTSASSAAAAAAALPSLESFLVSSRACMRRVQRFCLCMLARKDVSLGDEHCVWEALRCKRLTRRRRSEDQARRRPCPWESAVQGQQASMLGSSCHPICDCVCHPKAGVRKWWPYLASSQAGVLEAALEESGLVGVAHWSHDYCGGMNRRYKIK